MKVGEIKWHLAKVSDDSEFTVLFGNSLLRVVAIVHSDKILITLARAEEEEDGSA